MKLKPLVVAALLSISAAAKATTVIQPVFEQLVDNADRVVVAEPLSSTCEWRTNAAGALIFTTVRFRVAEVLKGKSTSELELSFLGGTIGPDTLEVSGMPRFENGSRLILFVSSNRTEICPLVGMFHGKFNLHRDAATGEETISRHDGSPLHVEPPNAASKSLIPLRHLTAAEFKQRVRNRVAAAR